MNTNSLTGSELAHRMKILENCGGDTSQAAKALGISPSQMRRVRSMAANMVHEPKPDIPELKTGSLAAKVLDHLKRGDCDLSELQKLTGLGAGAVRGILTDMHTDGFAVTQFGDKWSIAGAILPSGIEDASALPVLVSRPDNTFLVGASGDQHLCSKYHRPDVMNDLYDRFAAANVQAVYNTGNWIDGECRFNKHDLLVHGMEAQCRYLAANFPKRNGITTYAVSGDDHEGWYAMREGVDIGRFAERIMRESGRSDWVHLGHIEAYVRLQNYNTGKSSILAVCHPGGGSAYALSYSIQKIIEVLDGGEKPAVGFYGHYHKLMSANIRNVWALQTGTCKDQDPFMRKKKIDAHVGGAIVRMEQDPATGAIIGFEPNMIRYFNKGYYQNRWNYGDAVTLPERSRAA